MLFPICSTQSGTPRPPFDDLIRRLVDLNNFDERRSRSAAIISVDIPSGWHVEEGDLSGDGIKPDMLVWCVNARSFRLCDAFFPSFWCST